MFANNLASAAFSSSLLRLTGRGEKQNWENIAADAFGNALGQSSVDWLKNITTQSPPANPPATESPAANSTANAEPKTNTIDKAVRDNLVKGDTNTAMAARDGQVLQQAMNKEEFVTEQRDVISTRFDPVDEIVVTGYRDGRPSTSYMNHYVHAPYNENFWGDKKPKPLVSVRISNSNQSTYSLRDDASNADLLAGGASALGAAVMAQQINKAGIAAGLSKYERDLAVTLRLDSSQTLERLGKVGYLTFAATGAYSLSDFSEAYTNNDGYGMFKSVVDLGFGGAGAIKYTGPVGAVASFSYSATSAIVGSPLGEKYFMTPLADFIWDMSHMESKPTVDIHPAWDLKASLKKGGTK